MNDDTVEPDIDESIRRTFEASWVDGNPTSIEDVMDGADPQHPLATLEELVQIELEFRWKNAGDGETPRLEDYLERFEQLAAPEILTRLVQQEIELRVAAAGQPTREEYSDRFPGIDVEVPAADEAPMDTGVEEQAELDTSHEMATIQAPPAEESGGSRNSATIQGVERPQKPVVLEGDAIPGYDLLGELGRGGMGVVYKARDQKLKRVVALKMILGGGHASDDDTLRFQTEAEAVAKLQHPNIVQIYEVGEHEGRPYISLEYADGGNLDGMIAGTPQNAMDSAAMIESLARAMQVAHEQDIIHRDLKPANILITADGEPKITDFGLAKKMDDDSQQTKSGAVMGTPSYMPPEQAASNKDTLGPGADVYALGAILYHMVTGRPPFHAETQLDTLMQVIGEEPLAPRKLNSTLPVDLETICLKCLQKDISHRYESAEALAEDLRRFQSREPIEARPVSIAVRGWKWARRRPAIASLIGVSLAATVAIIVGGVMFTLALKAEKQKLLRSEYFLQIAKDGAEKNENQAKIAEQDAKEAHQAADKQRGLAEQREAEAIEAQQQARKAEADAKRLLANTHVSNGARFLQEGDTTGALKWFARAQSIDQQDEQENRIALMRTWNTLQQSPKPTSERVVNAVLDPSRLMNMSTNIVLNHSLTFSGKRLGTGAILDREGDRVLAFYAGQVGGTKSLARIWHIHEDSHSDNEGGKTSTGMQKLFARADNAAWSPDRSQVTTLSFKVSASAIGSAIRAKLTGKKVPAPIWFESHHVETGEALFSRPFERTWEMKYDPSGAYIFTRHDDGIGRLWDANTGQPLTEPQKHEFTNVWRASFTPDGKRMVVITNASEEIQAWDLASGTLDFEITNTNEYLQRLTTGPQGNWAAIATPDKILLVNLKTGKLHETKPLLPGKFSENNRYYNATLLFSPNSKLLMAHRGKHVQAWEMDSLKPVFAPLTQESHINYACFDEPGEQFLTCNDDGQVRIYDAKTGLLSQTPLKHDGPATWATFHELGRTIISFSSFNALKTRRATLYTWDLAASIPNSRPLRHSVGKYRASFHPTKDMVLTTGDDGRLVTWNTDPATPALEIEIPGLVLTSYSGNGKRILTMAVGDETVTQVWDAESGKALSPAIKQPPNLSILHLNQDGSKILTVTDKNVLRVFDSATGKIVFETATGLGNTFATFINQGKNILYLNDGISTLVETDDGKKIWEAVDLKPADGTYTRLTKSPNDKYYVATLDLKESGNDGETDYHYVSLFVRKMDNGKPVSQFGLSSDVRDLAFNTNGTRLAAGCEDGNVYVYETTEPNRPAIILEHRGAVNDIEFASGGRLLVTASKTIDGGGAAQVWDTTTGQPVTPPLVTPGKEMLQASFSPAGETILARAADAKEILLYPLSPPSTIDSRKILRAASALTNNSGSHVTSVKENDPLGWDEVRRSSPELTSPSSWNLARWHREKSQQAANRKNWDLAITHMTPVVESLNDRQSFYDRGWLHTLGGNFNEAFNDCRLAIEQETKFNYGWFFAASLALLCENESEYQKICELGLQRLSNSTHKNPPSRDLTVACILAPNAVVSYDRLLEFTSSGAARHQKTKPFPSSLGLHGKVLYRAGDHESAKQYLEKSIVWDTRLAEKNDEGELGTQDLETILQTGTPRDEMRTLDWLFLALCEAQLGNMERARMIYHHAQEYRASWEHDSGWTFQDSWADYVLEEARLQLDVEEEKQK